VLPRARIFQAALVLLIAMIGCGGDSARTRCAAPVRAEPGSLRERLFAAKTWMYQIQALDDDGALATLAATDYPLLVVEPGHNFAAAPYDTAAIVRTLRPRAGGGTRVLLAYIDIGQAEDYRDYWQPDWVPPTADAPSVFIAVHEAFPIRSSSSKFSAALSGSPSPIQALAWRDQSSARSGYRCR
jgi:cysteinyl-tRNA synthetase